MRKNGLRDRSGTLAEAVSALALFVPVFVLIVFVTIQASNAYVIARNMTIGAQTAARTLAEEYTHNQAITTNEAAQQAIFYNIRIPEMLSSNTQFEIPANGWQTAVEPRTVTVIVTYIPGVGSPANPPFPNPNLLNLGSAFKIAIPATYKLVSPPSVASPSGSGNGNGNGGGNNGGGSSGGGNGGGNGGGKK